jgi:hypothetical protein
MLENGAFDVLADAGWSAWQTEALGREDSSMVVMIETDKPGTDEADARRVLLVHRAASDGLCAGCLEFTCTFARFPCTQARWALKATAGAAEGGPS